MRTKSVLPFLLPAAIIFAAILIAGAAYMNRQPIPNQKIASSPTPTALPTTVEVTPSVTATPTVSDETILKGLVQIKSGIPNAKLEFSVGVITGDFAKGTVRNTDDMGGAPWFAGKINGNWVVSYVGQGVPTCIELGTIQYPKTWLSHCVNSQGNTVAR